MSLERIAEAVNSLPITIVAQGPRQELVSLPNAAALSAPNAVGWRDERRKRYCYRRQIETTAGRFRIYLEVPDRSAVGVPVLYGTIVRANALHASPGVHGPWMVLLPQGIPSSSARSVAIASNPLGWIPIGSQGWWRDAAESLPAFRERSFRFAIVLSSSPDTLYRVATEPQYLPDVEGLGIPVPSQAGNSAPTSSARWQAWLLDITGTRNPWHNHGLDEDPNHGAAADRNRFGVHPLGFYRDPDHLASRRELQRLLIGHLAVEGHRPFALPQIADRYEIPATDADSVYCNETGYHWTSNYKGGYLEDPQDRRNVLPRRGDNGWNGPSIEHCSSVLADLAALTGDLYAIEKARELAQMALTQLHTEHYFVSGYFSHRSLMRPAATAMKYLLLGEDEDLKACLARRLRTWLGSKISNPPSHMPRRDDEDPPGDGPCVDVWQLGIEAPVWYAFATKTNIDGDLRQIILQRLGEWQEWLVRCWLPPGEFDRAGGTSEYWRCAKQSDAVDPRIYSSLLQLDPGRTDHALLDWTHGLLALPPLTDALRSGPLAARRRTILEAFQTHRQMWSHPTKWSGPEEHLW